jgi:hypothetical protein
MTGEQAGDGQQPTPEEMAMMMADRLGKTPVMGIVMQSAATLVDCAGIRLGIGPQGDEVKDLEQAQQAIEGSRALTMVAEAFLGADEVAPLKEPIAQLQMLYADAVRDGSDDDGDDSGDGGSGGGDTPPDPPAPEPPSDPSAADRLWVPPGSRG